jgi:hypothetical protein
METTSTFADWKQNSEPIQGYVLKDRIGIGGNGEVWETIAPGGLRKAIKFVHGNIDEKRASRELTSLNRVRELNHPFLLNVERIEIVDHRLIIVTELADKSLEDLFNQYRSKGLSGIPRDELIRYMHEAADALDYLFEKQSLQHLDVKPGNILLVGDHVKVADFGLLKDLQDNGASLIHGLTPKYASPELFAGRPGRHSDQYSLAILYQAMLTGQFPFSGQSAAQLASQHLHSPPDLTSLSPHERFAVGKALSKESDQRFTNCREFVDRLTNRSSARMITTVDKGPVPSPKPVVNGSESRPSANAFRPHDGHTIVVAEPEVVSLPAIDLTDHPTAFRPTVFVGIGGTAGRVLTQLRRLLTDRFGAVADIPAFQFVYLDTDNTAINGAVSHDEGGALQERDALLLPLRPTSEYRGGELTDVQSISRRWLYNIPRSLHTNGLRALGRIALLDHSKRVLERLRSAIVTATDSRSVVSSTKETGLAFRESDPRVFVIASAAGGTGSGMVIDVGYAVRQILAESGLSDDELCGILTYSTAKGASSRNLAAANAYTCLNELRHFSNPVNDYPGELSRGLAGFREDAATFKYTYMLDLGDELTDEQFGDATDRLAEYLFLNSASPATSFFDACRDTESSENLNNTLRLRTFGLSRYGAENHNIPPQYIESLCKAVVRNWRGGATAARDDDRINLTDVDRLFDARNPAKPWTETTASLANQTLADFAVDFESIKVRIYGWIQEELNCDPNHYLEKVTAESVNKSRSEGASMEVQISTSQKLLNSILGLEDSIDPLTDSNINSLYQLVFPKAQKLGAEMGGQLKRSILDLVDNEGARVDGAQQAVLYFNAYLDAFMVDVAKRHRAAEEELETFKEQLKKLCKVRKFRKQANSGAMEQQMLMLANLMVNGLVLAAVCKAVQHIQPHITASSDELRDRCKDLNQLANEFSIADRNGAEKDNRSASQTSSEPDTEFNEFFESHRAELISRLNAEIEAKLFSADRRLRDILLRGGPTRAAFVSKLRAIARKVILQARKEHRFEYLRCVLQQNELADLSHPLKACMAVAEPEMQSSGGAKRLLVTLPQGLATTRLQDEIQSISGDEVTPVCESKTGVIVCYEVDDLSFEGVGSTFIRRRPECQDMAKRLHTRVDIAWSDG